MMDPTQLKRYKTQAELQARAQQMMAAAAQQAMLAPHTVTQILTSATGVNHGDAGQPLLLIGKLDGSRIDVSLSRQAAQDIVRQLTALLAETNGVDQ